MYINNNCNRAIDMVQIFTDINWKGSSTLKSGSRWRICWRDIAAQCIYGGWRYAMAFLLIAAIYQRRNRPTKMRYYRTLSRPIVSARSHNTRRWQNIDDRSHVFLPLNSWNMLIRILSYADRHDLCTYSGRVIKLGTICFTTLDFKIVLILF